MMGNNGIIFTIKPFGFKIGFHWGSFLLMFLAFRATKDYFSATFAPPLDFVFGLLGVVLVYAFLFAHEFGHYLATRKFGVKTSGVEFGFLGAQLNMVSELRRASHEFWMALAGPLTSLLLAGVCYMALVLLRDRGLSWNTALLIFSLGLYINLMLGIFNLLPAFPMDGGRVLRASIWYFTKKKIFSTKISAWISYVMCALTVILFALELAPFFLAILGIFIAISARQELMYLEMVSANRDRQ